MHLRTTSFDDTLSETASPLESFLMACVISRIHGLPQHELITLAKSSGYDSREVRKAVSQLVNGGWIEYTDFHGRPCLTVSFQRPIRISKRIVLVPSNSQQTFFQNQVVLRMDPSQSFGSGKHPTTRLCLNALDWAVEHLTPPQKKPFLDIGTGNGILSIAAIALGWPSGVAIDLDPCACNETRYHARINDCSDQIDVRETDIADPREKFELILANLRAPTLISLVPSLPDRMVSNGLVILSGYQICEADHLRTVFISSGFRLVWSEDSLGWSSSILMYETDCFT